MADGRYAAMLERLNALDSERIRQAEARKSSSAASTNPLESTGAFQSAFNEQRSNVERSLQTVGENPSQMTDTKAALDAIVVEIASLDKKISDASYFLPPYDVQASRNAVERLKASLDAAVAELLPKKKFSFRNKNPPPPKPQEVDIPSQAKPVASVDESATFLNANMHCIRDRSNANIVHDSGECKDSEVMLSDLKDCTVFLRGTFRAMFFHRLINCRVYAGAVTGSVLLEEVESCVCMLASHQIRIHSTTNTDFYLRVRSRPIVEYVSNVRFAPYAFHYQGLEEDLKSANLAEETGLWEKVDDFRWLRAPASPNWCVLPPDQRVHPVHS